MQKNGVHKFLGVKILDFRNFGYSEKKNTSHYNFDIQGKIKKCQPLFVTIYSEMIKMNFF